ncbi:hypothetical protein HFO55_06630 [Rhizobium leguminosarum]|uniref:hypothetical protein n=1 Tax=Rhizobium leguminosarum TaxID=384 RepID=UPI001C9695C2|nr:hypothetical protein [Rhizobium leguminosarum]MBY5566932.1 hypothetical protein [Rhizobium leguminosarum]MBY5574210.1 hypothetical protein [Rhizobium leguminosarum]
MSGFRTNSAPLQRRGSFEDAQRTLSHFDVQQRDGNNPFNGLPQLVFFWFGRLEFLLLHAI